MMNLLNGYVELHTLNQMDQKFIDCAHNHTAVKHELAELVGEDLAAEWLLLIFTVLLC